MHIDELDTPAVVIDLDIMERNLERLAAYCRAHRLDLRPHAKTHKIPEIARLQIAAGAVGVTVAKVGEARVMVDAGIDDILVAYPIVTERKADALAGLADRARISVAVDSIDAVRALAAAAVRRDSEIGILVEVDVGFHRCGLPSADAALALALQVQQTPGVSFLGLMFYPGHLLLPAAAQTAVLPAINERLDECYAAFQAADVQLAVVSGGSTPTAYRSHEFSGVTEIRPGMYPLYDRNMLEIDACAQGDCALTVLVTVVSTAVAGRAIVDGGSKTFSSDRLLAGAKSGHGVVVDDADTEFVAVSEEHGHLDISRSTRARSVGDRLAIIPNHVCTTINMHDTLYGHRNGRIECVWRVAGRGAVR